MFKIVSTTQSVDETIDLTIENQGAAQPLTVASRGVLKTGKPLFGSNPVPIDFSQVFFKPPYYLGRMGSTPSFSFSTPDMDASDLFAKSEFSRDACTSLDNGSHAIDMNSVKDLSPTGFSQFLSTRGASSSNQNIAAVLNQLIPGWSKTNQNYLFDASTGKPILYGGKHVVFLMLACDDAALLNHLMFDFTSIMLSLCLKVSVGNSNNQTSYDIYLAGLLLVLGKMKCLKGIMRGAEGQDLMVELNQLEPVQGVRFKQPIRKLVRQIFTCSFTQALSNQGIAYFPLNCMLTKPDFDKYRFFGQHRVEVVNFFGKFSRLSKVTCVVNSLVHKLEPGNFGVTFEQNRLCDFIGQNLSLLNEKHSQAFRLGQHAKEYVYSWGAVGLNKGGHAFYQTVTSNGNDFARVVTIFDDSVCYKLSLLGACFHFGNQDLLKQVVKDGQYVICDSLDFGSVQYSRNLSTPLTFDQLLSVLELPVNHDIIRAFKNMGDLPAKCVKRLESRSANVTRESQSLEAILGPVAAVVTPMPMGSTGNSVAAVATPMRSTGNAVAAVATPMSFSGDAVAAPMPMGSSGSVVATPMPMGFSGDAVAAVATPVVLDKNVLRPDFSNPIFCSSMPLFAASDDVIACTFPDDATLRAGTVGEGVQATSPDVNHFNHAPPMSPFDFSRSLQAGSGQVSDAEIVRRLVELIPAWRASRQNYLFHDADGVREGTIYGEKNILALAIQEDNAALLGCLVEDFPEFLGRLSFSCKTTLDGEPATIQLFLVGTLMVLGKINCIRLIVEMAGNDRDTALHISLFQSPTNGNKDVVKLTQQERAKRMLAQSVAITENKAPVAQIFFPASWLLSTDRIPSYNFCTNCRLGVSSYYMRRDHEIKASQAIGERIRMFDPDYLGFFKHMQSTRDFNAYLASRDVTFNTPFDTYVSRQDLLISSCFGVVADRVELSNTWGLHFLKRFARFFENSRLRGSSIKGTYAIVTHKGICYQLNFFGACLLLGLNRIIENLGRQHLVSSTVGRFAHYGQQQLPNQQLDEKTLKTLPWQPLSFDDLCNNIPKLKLNSDTLATYNRLLKKPPQSNMLGSGGVAQRQIGASLPSNGLLRQSSMERSISEYESQLFSNGDATRDLPITVEANIRIPWNTRNRDSRYRRQPSWNGNAVGNGKGGQGFLRPGACPPPKKVPRKGAGFGKKVPGKNGNP